MKKLISVILCVLMLASVAVIPAAAADACAHEHTYTVLETEADLFNDGFSGIVYCSDCHQVVDFGHTVDALSKNNVLHNTYMAVKDVDLSGIDSAIKNIDYEDLAVTGASLAVLALSNVDLEKVDLSKVDLGNVDLSKVDLTKVDLGKLDFSKADFSKVTEGLKDVDYKELATLGAGLAVLALSNSDLKLDFGKFNFSNYSTQLANLKNFSFDKVDYTNVAVAVAPVLLNLLKTL